MPELWVLLLVGTVVLVVGSVVYLVVDPWGQKASRTRLNERRVEDTIRASHHGGTWGGGTGWS